MLEIVFYLIVLLFSVIIHEVSHGNVANYLGDPTAKYEGRLTLNPLKHLDPIGSFFFPLFMFFLTLGRGPIFGWAKPVPVNSYNFQNPKLDNAKVAAAGPLANLIVASVFGFLIRFLPLPTSLLFLFSLIVVTNLFLALFNLMPIPPLDGHHILFALLPEAAVGLKMFLRQYGFLILILMVFFGFKSIAFLAFTIYRWLAGIPFML